MMESPTNHLHESATKFLQNLNLPYLHPSCVEGYDFSNSAPQDGYKEEITFFSWNDLSIGSIVTLYWNVAPPLLAMGELWLRLFAFLVAPMCITYLIYIEISQPGSSSKTTGSRPQTFYNNNQIMESDQTGIHEKIAIIFGLASSSVILTDTLYVLEYGRFYGSVLFGTMLLLSHRSYQRKSQTKASPSDFLSHINVIIILLTFLCIIPTFINLDESIGDFSIFRHVTNMKINAGFSSSKSWAEQREISIGKGIGLDLPNIAPGFYYQSNNSLMASIAKEWPEHLRRYEPVKDPKTNKIVSGNATPYLVTGDSRTGIPFILNHSPDLERGVRVWIKSKEDIGEANAIDIFFPEDGVHKEDKPLIMVLHGLNGGENKNMIIVCIL